MTNDDIEQLKQIVQSSEEKIIGSGVFLGLHSKGWRKDPVPLLQLALAIMHGKPIALIMCDEEPVPENLRKIAISIQRVRKDNREDMTAAVKEISRVLNELTPCEGEKK